MDPVLEIAMAIFLLFLLGFGLLLIAAFRLLLVWLSTVPWIVDTAAEEPLLFALTGLLEL